MRMRKFRMHTSRRYELSGTMYCRQMNPAGLPRIPTLHQRGGDNLNDYRLHQKPRKLHGFHQDRLSTIRLVEEKPIVRSPRPQSFNKQLLAVTKMNKTERPKVKGSCSNDRNGNEELFQSALQRRWTSTTREATEEYALPTPRFSVPRTTLEVHADPVRYRVEKTGPEPHVWQCYAREWDMMQLRGRMGPATKAGFTL